MSGTWFRMAQPGGTPESGPDMPNGDSIVPGGAATLLEPGTEGGLRTGGYQSEPNPAFAGGNSLAGSITKPTKFFAVEFGTSTNPVDPQTQRGVVAPTVVNRGGVLTADLSAWGASWNNQEFNQGAPKPPAKAGPEVAVFEPVEQVWDWVAQKWLEPAERNGCQRAPGDRHVRPGQPCLHSRVDQPDRGWAVQRLHRRLAPRGRVRTGRRRAGQCGIRDAHITGG